MLWSTLRVVSGRLTRHHVLVAAVAAVSSSTTTSYAGGRTASFSAFSLCSWCWSCPSTAPSDVDGSTMTTRSRSRYQSRVQQTLMAIHCRRPTNWTSMKRTKTNTQNPVCSTNDLCISLFASIPIADNFLTIGWLTLINGWFWLAVNARASCVPQTIEFSDETGKIRPDEPRMVACGVRTVWTKMNKLPRMKFNKLPCYLHNTLCFKERSDCVFNNYLNRRWPITVLFGTFITHTLYSKRYNSARRPNAS